MASPPPLLDVRGLEVSFPSDEGVLAPVRGVSFSIPAGGTVGLVGESGSGKTLTGLSFLQLVPRPGRVSGGEMLFRMEGAETVDIAGLAPDGEAVRALRGRRIAMVFQEPMSSLTPVYTIGEQIGEMVRLHRKVGRREAREVAVEMLRRVGIPDPQQRVNEYPHQLSGGMRQRAMIAMALSCEPSLLIADEPTTALDVTVQAQILDLFRELREQMGMAILLISHDLGVIADLAEEVVVMYAGRVVERGPAEALFYDARHPYTQGLLRSAPVLGRPHGEKLYSIPGSVPSLRAIPRGCAFRPRCEERFEPCRELPELEAVGEGHWVRCWARSSGRQ
jgi:oligopeptide/dipeptide ABC transporter ATP-binding protein